MLASHLRPARLEAVTVQRSNPRRPLPFSLPDWRGRELDYLTQSLNSRQIGGDGDFSTRCHAFLSEHFGAPTLLAHSCTAALEMAAILADVGPGDEVIMPSYTFTSTANAFALRGAAPVFVDIRTDTLNIDEALVEAAVTPRTRAVAVVHYAGVGCAMDEIGDLARRRGLRLIEDAAQGYLASYRGRKLGTFGALGAVSFDQAKTVVCGEGGALIVNDPSLELRAHVVRQKGTNRTQFLRGEVDQYDWQDIGSAFALADLLAAVLLAQLEAAEAITARRLALWSRYHDALAGLAANGDIVRPRIPDDAAHNGHIYHVRFGSAAVRERVRKTLLGEGIPAVSHFVPLHSSPAGRRLGRTGSAMPVTEAVAATLLRLPLHSGMTDDDVDHVVDRLRAAL
jgi:dTDP-4-amino-4,6-dideoxygalactose transaminase